MTGMTAAGGRLQKSVASFKATSDPYRNILFAVIIITVSRIHQHFSFLRPVRPALTLVALACIYAWLNPKYLAVGSILKTRNGKLMAALGAMACLSAPLGISLGNSVMYVLTEYSKVLLLAVLVMVAIRNAADLYKIVWAFVAAAGFLAWLSLFVFKISRAGGDFARIQSGYSYDSNDIGLVAVVSLGLAILMFQTSRGKAKMLALIILACLGMTIGRTGSRGAFLGIIAVGGALLVLLKSVPVTKRIGFVVVTLFGLLLAAPPGYWKQMGTILSPEEDYNMTSATGRKAVLIRGLGYMMLNPLTGIGIDNFGRAEGQLSDRAIAQSEDPALAGIKWSAAHDSFLQAAAEMGIPGIVLFCMLVFGSIRQCFQIRSRLPRSWEKGDPEERFLYLTAVYLPVSLIGFAVCGAFVSFAYLDPIYLLAALVAGLQTATDLKLSQLGATPTAAPQVAVRLPGQRGGHASRGPILPPSPATPKR